MKRALELAGHATALQGSNDWWWQERLGKAYYQLGLLRDADKHFAAAADLQVGCACDNELASLQCSLCRACVTPADAHECVQVSSTGMRHQCSCTPPIAAGATRGSLYLTLQCLVACAVLFWAGSSP